MGLRLGFYALIAIVGFVTAGLGLISKGSHGQTTGQVSAIAAPLADNGNGNGNNNGNGNDNDDEDNDNNDNDEDNQNEGDSGDPFAALAASAGAGADGGCAQAGTDRSFGSADGRIAVRVFPTMSRNVRITIANPIDPASVPANPGQKVDALLFRVTADDCGGGGIATLPAEVNLAVRYSDADVGGLNEASFKLAWLDPADNTWKPLAKQAPDPGANFVSATIQNTGVFVVYQ
jgi:hypothetical protein